MDTSVITHDDQAASAPSPAAVQPIDLVHLSRYTLGNQALQCEVLQLFAEQAPLTLAQLRTAETQKAWRDAAHTLKGSARAVGAWRVGNCAEKAEAIGVGAQEKGPLIQTIGAALDEAVRYITSLAQQP
jgi:HPt (histidine-containing phosphotransfer) domain-containing protein